MHLLASYNYLITIRATTSNYLSIYSCSRPHSLTFIHLPSITMPGLPVPADMPAMTAAWPASRIIQDPIGLVDDLFAIQPTTAYTTDWSLPSFIQQQFALPNSLPSPQPSHLSLIPQLSLACPVHSAPSHSSLVRLRCLVQDTHSSDYYLAAYRTGSGWHTARYRDSVRLTEEEGGVDESSVVTMERTDVTVVALTGENEWVQQALPTKSEKRRQPGSDGQRRSVRKRQLEEQPNDDMEQESPSGVEAADGVAAADSSMDPSKKPKAASETAINAAGLTASSTTSCVVTLYGSHCHALRVGDVVEVLGIYSITPHLLQDDDQLGHNAIHSSHHIHCLTLLRCSPPFINMAPPHSLSIARSGLLSHLTAVCGGDSTAATLLLLCFLSRVQRRSAEGVMGKLTVELTRSTSAFAQRLTTLCAKLLTHSTTVHISTSTLSTQPLYPQKDYESDRLTHSPLLLPSTAGLLLDATQLTTGELSAVGARNVRVLNRLLEECQLLHDFAYHEVAVPLDVSAVVLSAGKGLLFAHVSLPLLATANEAAEGVEAVGECEWELWRQYMAHVKGESVKFHVSDSVGGVVEQLFVQRRRDVGEVVQAEWLHRVLLVARLVVRSYGEEELTEPRLMEAVRLLDEVEQRAQIQLSTATAQLTA